MSDQEFRDFLAAYVVLEDEPAPFRSKASEKATTDVFDAFDQVRVGCLAFFVPFSFVSRVLCRISLSVFFDDRSKQTTACLDSNFLLSVNDAPVVRSRER